MKTRLADNDVNDNDEGNSVVAEKFLKSLKGEIYKRMPSDDSKFCFGYSNKLVDEYNILIIVILVRNIFMLIILLFLKNLKCHEALKFIVGDRIVINKYENFFRKDFTGKWSEQMFCD